MEAATLVSLMEERIDCPACGGAGGGPFGRAGSAWDDDEYICPRCKGEGKIIVEEAPPGSMRPGLVKAQPEQGESEKRKKTG